MKSYTKMWNNIFNVSGRTTRKDYWIALIMNIIIVSIAGLLMGLINDPESFVFRLVAVITSVYGFAFAIATTTMAIRRLHDIGKSGWWLLWCTLLNIVFFLGSIIYIVFMLTASKGDNQWGPREANINS